MSASVDTMKNFFNVLKIYAYDVINGFGYTDTVLIASGSWSTIQNSADI